MKIQHISFLLGALSLTGSLQAQTIDNGQDLGVAFQMDITIPAVAGRGWFLQQAPALPAAAWNTIGGPYSPGPTFPVRDTPSGQSYYRLVRALPPLLATDCGVNRYGFIRKKVVPGFCMYADPLLGDTGNTLPNILPVLNDQTTFYQYSGGWSLDVWEIMWPGWTFGTATLNPGEGCFLENPGVGTLITFIGSVPEGVLVTPLVPGYNMVSSQVPQAGLVTTDLGFNPNDQDVVLQFDCATQTYFRNIYDLSGVGGWDPGEPIIDVGESFWIYRNKPGSWKQVFSACP